MARRRYDGLKGISWPQGHYLGAGDPRGVRLIQAAVEHREKEDARL